MIDLLETRRDRFYRTWEYKLPMLILYSRHRLYLSNTVRPGFLWVTPDLTIHYSTRAHDRARQEADVDRVIEVDGMGHMLERIRQNHSPGTIGLETQKIPASLRDRIVGTLDCEVRDASQALESVRMVKDSFEQEKLREAARQSDAAHRRAREAIRAGRSELEIAAEIEAAARAEGHEGIVGHGRFDASLPYGLIVSGENLSNIGSYAYVSHGTGPTRAFPISAGHRTVAENDPVVVDIGGVHYGYNADVSRTYIAGSTPADQLQQSYRYLEDVYHAIEDKVRAGVTAEELYKTGHQASQETPYADYFQGYDDKKGRFVGHGIGLEIDEKPVLSPGNPTSIPEGAAITIEIQFIFPEGGAVKIEESCLVEENGVEIISSIPRDLFVCGEV